MNLEQLVRTKVQQRQLCPRLNLSLFLCFFLALCEIMCSCGRTLQQPARTRNAFGAARTIKQPERTRNAFAPAKHPLLFLALP